MSDRPRVNRTTQLLRQMARGDDRSAEELLPLVYAELHQLAQQFMRNERDGHTLQPTALLHEAWLRLTDQGERTPEDRGHFVRVAARAMRNVLVDHARRRAAEKRGSGRRVIPLGDVLEPWEKGGLDVLDLHEALERLAEKDEALPKLVELRFFAGLTLEETAAALDVSVAQARWSWGLARGWLRRELIGGEPADG